MDSLEKLTVAELWQKLAEYKKMQQSCTVRRIVGNIIDAIRRKS